MPATPATVWCHHLILVFCITVLECWGSMACTGSFYQDLKEDSNMQPSCSIAASLLGPKTLALEVFLNKLCWSGSAELGLAGGYKWWRVVGKMLLSSWCLGQNPTVHLLGCQSSMYYDWMRFLTGWLKSLFLGVEISGWGEFPGGLK